MDDLTNFAQQGYDAPAGTSTEFTHGSTAFLAWRVGQWLKANGGIRPSKVVSEAGYAVSVDGVRVVIPAGATGEPYIPAA